MALHAESIYMYNDSYEWARYKLWFVYVYRIMEYSTLCIISCKSDVTYGMFVCYSDEYRHQSEKLAITQFYVGCSYV